MARSAASLLTSESAAPPKMRTEFILPRRPNCRYSMLAFLPVEYAGILPRSRFHVQRQHLKRPHVEQDLVAPHLDHPFRLFEQVEPLGSTDAGGEAQGCRSARAVRFVEAHDHPSPVLRPLEAPEGELHPFYHHEPVLGGCALGHRGDERAVERERFPGYPRLGPVSGMREQAVSEAVLALIGERVRVEWALEEADAEHVVPGAVAVLAVVQEGDAVARLREVGEAVGADLEACRVPGRVAVRRMLCDAVHRLEGGFVGADAHGEERPQQYLPLVPVYVRLDVQAPRGGEQTVGLRYARSSPASLDPHRGAQGSILHDLHALTPEDLLPLHLVVPVYVPGIPVGRLVHAGPEPVAVPVEDLALRLFVVDAPEAAVGGDLHPQDPVLDKDPSPRLPDLDAGRGLRRSTLAAQRQRNPSQARNLAVRCVDEETFRGSLRRKTLAVHAGDRTFRAQRQNYGERPGI